MFKRCLWSKVNNLAYLVLMHVFNKYLICNIPNLFNLAIGYDKNKIIWQGLPSFIMKSLKNKIISKKLGIVFVPPCVPPAVYTF